MVLTARTERPLEEAARHLGEATEVVAFPGMRVTQATEPRRFASLALDRFGRLDSPSTVAQPAGSIVDIASAGGLVSWPARGLKLKG